MSKPDRIDVRGIDPERIALLLDVDGTLAPIVDDPSDSSVPLEVRRTLVALARRLGLVCCVSGRSADDARRVVGVAAITYIGCHGSELLEPGMPSTESDPRMDLWTDPVDDVAIEAMRELSGLGVRREQKGAIAALHWRGASDETAAFEGLERIAAIATERGLVTHWGRKVLELRPPVPFDKGRAIESLLTSRADSGSNLEMSVYVGDDLTDIDAFDSIRRLVEAGICRSGVCIGVLSDETPDGLEDASDMTVDGPEGVELLLEDIRGSTDA
mgnify:CR=1 FL=1